MASCVEDFSFPAIDLPPQFVNSPPLWPYTISEASCSDNPKKIVENIENIHEGKFGFSAPNNTNHNPRTNFSSVDSTNDEEEKMDMLWEDMNEKFPARTSGRSPAREVKISRVRTLKLSKAKKKPSMVVFLKVLKRIFVMNNSRHHSTKKRTW
ncbi:Hypothetical predicted protein [Olea europaea subsp. europaea]|uniref:Uncharacterized protein n=1 Tax=Olea europaea subsp. europaea TaxID=158383 RepID=A0A8S0U186_OLEEU|nr:Hypothetical predicted protein [Olea europaea subsp. europaea]